jgi:16S rRNA (uracil1498-N3)-methyltransferase
MNLILLEEEELTTGLDRSDDRVIHIVEVLGCGPRDWFDIGIPDGPRGKARMEIGADDQATFEYVLGDEPPQLYPITLIVGMPRPQTARRLLREMTALGVENIWFPMSDRSEPGYATSRLWSTGEYARHVREGAEQAFCTRLPNVATFVSLQVAIEEAPGENSKVALDNYEAECRLSTWRVGGSGITLALGAERGWSAGERDTLRGAGFELMSLGDRVLRVETAAVAAVTLLLRDLD